VQTRQASAPDNGNGPQVTEPAVSSATPDANNWPDMSGVPHEQRMLLLPHCLRPVQGCPGRMTERGLDCEGCSRSDCKIYAIRQAASLAGYRDICVAPGGRLAVRYVSRMKPAAIIAIACDKELRDGAAAVAELGWESNPPLLLRVPLLRDGCVDTDVDMEQVLLAMGR
jgi:hypothetical protein